MMNNLKNMYNKLKKLIKEVDISVVEKNNKLLFFIILKNNSLIELQNIFYIPENNSIEIELTDNKKILIEIDFIMNKILKINDKKPEEYYLLDKKEMQNGENGLWLKLEI